MSTSTTRPRATSSASRAFSHRSDNSHGSKTKDVLSDSPAEKQRRDSFWKGGSKANPNAAMNEVQPGDAAMTEKSTIESLRNIQHKDANGNLITEPDLCNPTRPRWERPLDTIRSFERAIDGGYKRRSMNRSESYSGADQSRRSSYYGGGSNFDSGRHENGPQYNAGYYGARRPDGYSDAGVSPAAPPSRNRFGQRMGGSRSNSAYGFNPQHAYNDSHDTGHSDSTGQWGNSTDPSSENSSIERAYNGGKPNDPYAQHDIHNGAPIMEEYASDSDGGYGMSWGNNKNIYNGGAPMAPPHSQAPPVRAPISLGGGPGAVSSQGGSLPSTARPTPAKEEKKKGFFKKRFSKA